MFCSPMKMLDHDECFVGSDEDNQKARELIKELTFWEVSPKEESRSPSPEAESRPEADWKTAVDPHTGRTYYYDAITRKTQWEKPPEIRAAEKLRKMEQRKRDKEFFKEMEGNIRASLARGESIPGVAAPHQERKVATPPPADDALPFPGQPARVRTISGILDETLLAALSVEEPTLTTKATTKPIKSTSTVSKPPTAPCPKPADKPTAKPDLSGRPPLPARRATSREESSDSFTLSPDDGTREKLPEDTLAGEHLLDAPIHENVSLDSSGERSHVRRNTGSTIYVKSTMTNPDIQATIKCVCGVFRAHILQATEKRMSGSPVSVASRFSTEHAMHDVFLDDDKAQDVPLLDEVVSFYQDFYQRSQMEQDTIIISLVYAERLIKETNGQLAPVAENWKSILFACMVMASKVWDDLSMWNVDFSNVCGRQRYLKSFTLRRINELELAMLKCLNFVVKVPASEYAKYYFLIRSMLIKSGLLDEEPLDRVGVQKLEPSEVSSHTAGNNRRTKSLNDYDWLSPGPVLNQSVCLEQLVTMNR